MERKLKILLVEDDTKACQAITDEVNKLKDIYLVGTTNNTLKAIALIENDTPDAIILDLELHKGAGNGLEFLIKLKDLTLEFTPFILVTTHNTSSVTYDLARELGADFILCKSQDDYCAKNVVNFLHSMKKSLHAKTYKNKVVSSESQQISKNNNANNLKTIGAELYNVGINPKSLGFKYLTDAIILCQNSINYDFKTELSTKYKKTPKSIERAMNNAIISAWNTTHIDDLSKYYTAKVNPKKGCPTLLEFIYYYTTKLS